MVPAGIAEEPADEASRIREENARIRADNQRLRALVSVAQPETPEADFCLPSTPTGNSGAVDVLAELMSEGGRLLRQRETLQAENAALEGTEQEEEAKRHVAEEETADVSDPFEGKELAAMERLMPLLSEGDALRTERQKLRAERQGLLAELHSTGDLSSGLADFSKDEGLALADAELENSFLAAIDETRRENLSLEGEITTLRQDNARLRQSRDISENKSRVLPVPPKTKASPAMTAVQVVPAQQEEEFEVPGSRRDAQRDVMKQLLYKSRVSSPSNSTKAGSAKKAADNGTVEVSCGLRSTQEEAVKQHLHTLFRTFAR